MEAEAAQVAKGGFSDVAVQIVATQNKQYRPSPVLANTPCSCYPVHMMNRYSVSLMTPARTEAAKAVPAQKAPRQVPKLSPAQSKLYQGIGSNGAFSLENLANGYTRSKQE